MQVDMNALLTVILVLLTAIYTILGGLIIQSLELDNETATRTNISYHLDQALQQFICMLCSHSVFLSCFKNWFYFMTYLDFYTSPWCLE